MPGNHRHPSSRTNQSSRRPLGLLARTAIGRTDARETNRRSRFVGFAGVGANRQGVAAWLTDTHRS